METWKIWHSRLSGKKGHRNQKLVYDKVSKLDSCANWGLSSFCWEWASEQEFAWSGPQEAQEIISSAWGEVKEPKVL